MTPSSGTAGAQGDPADGVSTDAGEQLGGVTGFGGEAESGRASSASIRSSCVKMKVNQFSFKFLERYTTRCGITFIITRSPISI
jgi:hypothetical protein